MAVLSETSITLMANWWILHEWTAIYQERKRIFENLVDE
ncbi:hypothetical protein CGMCC3_g3303 [Colletotrichum fructicola]|nr:uncharacterized protein CGMCC3_g3303 [Colletotrichum fructicola]KAE9580391.1 hypothetical protein CGMCC3_g3303 [Colletotrichum fructicola]